MIVPDNLTTDVIRSEIEEVCTTFSTVLLDLGFKADYSTMPAFDACDLSSVTDEYDGEEVITGRWLDHDGQQLAHFIRYANGLIFAERDVLKAHPTRVEHFVEAIEVWGSPGRLKHDLRLLPSL